MGRTGSNPGLASEAKSSATIPADLAATIPLTGNKSKTKKRTAVVVRIGGEPSAAAGVTLTPLSAARAPGGAKPCCQLLPVGVR
jgi:hypothetical protein